MSEKPNGRLTTTKLGGLAWWNVRPLRSILDFRTQTLDGELDMLITMPRLLSIPLVAASVILAGCGSSEDGSREAASVPAISPASIIELPPAQDTIQMQVGQVGEFVALPDDSEYVIESSAPDVVDIFEGYTDDSGIRVDGAGVVALSIGVAEILVYNPEDSTDPIEQFRIFVTEPETDPGDTGDDASAGAIVGSGTLGSRLCVENATTGDADRDYTKVTFTKADSAENGYVRAGRTLCAEGTDRGPLRYDVRGQLAFRDIPLMEIWAQNPWAGYPGAGVQWMWGKAPKFDAAFCLGGLRFDVGDSYYGDNGVYRLVLTRLPDTKWKEFRLRIEDSPNPTPDGSFRRCT